MKMGRAILVFGGILFTVIALSGTAHACGGDKEAKVMQEEPDRKVQSEAPASKKVATNETEVYGPPAPTDLDLSPKLSQSGSR
jgi:hypothetical protein